jgi:hypothetical protein
VDGEGEVYKEKESLGEWDDMAMGRDKVGCVELWNSLDGWLDQSVDKRP